ncbi:MAG: CsgG/HfaB family protein [Treponema sp.]|nr:CsgG/HfaB family protein [Treponema sp.]
MKLLIKKYICFLYITIFSITTIYANDLTGAWTATVEQNRSFDTYKINLTADGRCTVKVSNDSAEQETSGNWSWDGTLFKLTARFRNNKLSYLPNIQWSSVVNFTADNNSFNILGKIATNGSQARITFFRQDGFDEDFNQKVIPQIFADLSKDIPPRSRLAIVGIDSPNPNESAFYVNEMTLQFVNSKNFTVVDRSNIDAVLTEQNFQMSGYVDDDAFVSIGKFLGATVIITGNISGTGSQKRMVIKAIDVLTSKILSMVSTAL